MKEIEIPEGKRAEWVNDVLTLVDDNPQSITERIKTLDDAEKWCDENGKKQIVDEYITIYARYSPSADIIAYLRLRIITAALNEGWEPTFEDDGYVGYYNKRRKEFSSCAFGETYFDSSSMLRFKSKELALYAATQFADIYDDFCGTEEG